MRLHMWNLFDQHLLGAVAMASVLDGFLEILFVERGNPEYLERTLGARRKPKTMS